MAWEMYELGKSNLIIKVKTEALWAEQCATDKEQCVAALSYDYIAAWKAIIMFVEPLA